MKPLQVFSYAAITYQRKLISCGKAACKCCPHGPYWYAFWWSTGKRKTVSKYLGKVLDDHLQRRADEDQGMGLVLSLDAAAALLGVDPMASTDDAYRAWDHLTRPYRRPGGYSDPRRDLLNRAYNRFLERDRE